jgi:hypothetical protein
MGLWRLLEVIRTLVSLSANRRQPIADEGEGEETKKRRIEETRKRRVAAQHWCIDVWELGVDKQRINPPSA